MQEIKTPFKVKGELEFDIIEITEEYELVKCQLKLECSILLERFMQVQCYG